MIKQLKLVTSNQVVWIATCESGDATWSIISCAGNSNSNTYIVDIRVCQDFWITISLSNGNFSITYNAVNSIVLARYCADTSYLNNITNIDCDCCSSDANFTTYTFKIKVLSRSITRTRANNIYISNNTTIYKYLSSRTLPCSCAII